MDYRTLIDLMISHPDVYLITGSKYLDQANITKEFTQIVAYAKEKDPSVLNRFVIQIYYPEMLELYHGSLPLEVSNLYPISKSRLDSRKRRQLC